jgi:hypothetical protein
MMLGATMLGAMSLGAMSLGAVSLGAMSLGAMSLGAMSLGAMLLRCNSCRRQTGLDRGRRCGSFVMGRGENVKVVSW